MYVYIASSWRNDHQPELVEHLRRLEIDCYDFKDSAGFHWHETGLVTEPGGYINDFDAYINALEHPAAKRGFARDMNALKRATHTVLVLPCGRSAHLELGYAVGAGQRTAIWAPDFDQAELMYGMVDHIATNKFEILHWLFSDQIGEETHGQE